MKRITGAFQLRLDTTDTARSEIRRDLAFERAVHDQLAAVRDHARPDGGYIVYPPKLGYCELATSTSCTCQGFQALSICEHCELIRRLELAGRVVTEDIPVHATELIEMENVA